MLLFIFSDQEEMNWWKTESNDLKSAFHEHISTVAAFQRDFTAFELQPRLDHLNNADN